MMGKGNWSTPHDLTELETHDRWTACADQIMRLDPRQDYMSLAMFTLPALYGIRDGLRREVGRANRR